MIGMWQKNKERRRIGKHHAGGLNMPAATTKNVHNTVQSMLIRSSHIAVRKKTDASINTLQVVVGGIGGLGGLQSMLIIRNSSHQPAF